MTTLHTQATTALAAARKADAERTPGEWWAASSNRRKDGIALVGLASMRGQGERGCIAVLAGSGAATKARHQNAHLIADLANTRAAVLDLIADTLDDHSPRDDDTCHYEGAPWPCHRFRLVLAALGVDDDEGNDDE